MIINPETLLTDEKNIDEEYLLINNNKYYKITQHVWAVITYRILRVNIFVKEKKVSFDSIREFLRRYFAVGNYLLREYGEQWIQEAETIAEAKLIERKNDEQTTKIL